jgi:hypothetical protein
MLSERASLGFSISSPTQTSAMLLKFVFLSQEEKTNILIDEEDKEGEGGTTLAFITWYPSCISQRKQKFKLIEMADPINLCTSQQGGWFIFSQIYSK